METSLIERTENLTPIMTPQEQVNKASEMAKVLQKVVDQGGLAKSFGGEKKHLEFEAWQTIGQFFNCTPVTEWTHPLEEDGKVIGYEAKVNVVNQEGRVIGSAENMCMRDEPNWKGKPNYALRSMAQTRAAGKALRSVFAWVAVLAGYSATPAEEMDTTYSTTEEDKPKIQDPDAPITDKQRKKLWAMMMGAELDKGQGKEFFDWMNPQTKGQGSEFIENFEQYLEMWKNENVIPDQTA